MGWGEAFQKERTKVGWRHETAPPSSRPLLLQHANTPAKKAPIHLQPQRARNLFPLRQDKQQRFPRRGVRSSKDGWEGRGSQCRLPHPSLAWPGAADAQGLWGNPLGFWSWPERVASSLPQSSEPSLFCAPSLCSACALDCKMGQNTPLKGLL